MRHEYLTLEHLLLALLRDAKTRAILNSCGANIARLQKRLEQSLEETVEKLPVGADSEPQQTMGVERVLQRAAIHALSAEQKVIDGGDVLAAMFREDESHALYLLQQEGLTRLDVLNYISHGIPKDSPGEGSEPEDGEGAPQRDPLEAFTTNLNIEAKEGRIDPLIGRTQELERTIQVLCRRRKNNPLYVCETGVCKTAITEALALKHQTVLLPDDLNRSSTH